MQWRDNARPMVRHQEQAIEELVNAVMYTYEAEVEGDVVEFGVATGSTAVAIASGMAACHHYSLRGSVKAKRLHLFDSFKGLPEEEVDTAAPHVQSGAWRKGKCNAGYSAEKILALVTDRVVTGLDASSVQIYEGWFAQTVEGFCEKVAMVHVDCDLYSSTVDCLGPLFARGQIRGGCVLMFDDWNCNRADPEHGERRAWRYLAMRHGIAYSDEGGYGLFGRKMIVHGYTANGQ